MEKTLQDAIEESKADIIRFNEAIIREKERLNDLKGLYQPSMTELYGGISQMFTVEVENTTYEHILGGDGRSAPWNETRGGKVAKIKIGEGIWLNREQMDVIEGYVKKIYSPDHIVI